MRLRLATALVLLALPVFPAYGEQAFPYTAYVNADNVYVRSGPGRDYYPTSKLNTGDKVEVYRHDPGGWYAIRPVEGSFSWVSARFLQPGQGGLATVTGDRVAARVGSRFSDIRDVIQVRLHQGEIVEILGEKEFAGQPESGTWYQIAPPSGEFRWVHGKFVDADYHLSGVRKAPADYSPLVAERQAPDELAAATGASFEQVIDPTARAAATETPPPQTAPPETAARETAPAQEVPAETSPAETAASARHTNKFDDRAQDPSGAATLRRLSPEEFQKALEGVDMELSIMLAEEPTVWKLDELDMRVNSLLAEAETAVERGRVRLLANRIALSQDIKRRHDAVSNARLATERRDRQLSGLAESREVARESLAPASRFDGQGRLVRVVPPKLGSPRFALVNETGDVACYVTPAPGVNLNYYVGRPIGVNGIRGYMAESRAQHVVAKHVMPLDAPRLR
jgi:SH3-like domain-containing protein